MSDNATEYRRACPDSHVEVRKEGDKDKILLLASVFNKLSENLGNFREIILPGAFDNTLREIKAGKRDVSARVQHEGGIMTIGRVSNNTLTLWTDERGLWAAIIPPDTQIGRDTTTMVRDKYLDKASFAFDVRPGGESMDYDADPMIRTVKDVNLYDVSVVDGPAYEQTHAQIRSIDAPAFERERERVRRGSFPPRFEFMTIEEQKQDIQERRREADDQAIRELKKNSSL